MGPDPWIGPDLSFHPGGGVLRKRNRPEDLPFLRKRLEQAFKTARGRLRLSVLPNLPLEQLESYYLDLNYPALQVCDSLWKGCRILPDGTVSPCLHVAVGNITAEPSGQSGTAPGCVISAGSSPAACSRAARAAATVVTADFNHPGKLRLEPRCIWSITNRSFPLARKPGMPPMAGSRD